MGGHGVHRVEVLDDPLLEVHPAAPGEDLRAVASIHQLHEPLLPWRDEAPPQAALLIGDHDGGDDVFDALGDQPDLLQARPHHLEVGLGEGGSVALKGLVDVGVEDDGLHPGLGVTAELRETLEAAHVEAGLLEDLVELVVEDDQALVALLEDVAADEVLQDLDQVALLRAEGPAGDGLEDALEDVEMVGIVVVEPLKDRLQARSGVLLMERVQEEVVHLPGGPPLPPGLLPGVQSAQGLLVVGVLQPLEALPLGGLLDGSQHGGLEIAHGAVAADRHQVASVPAPVAHLLRPIGVLLGVVGEELLHLWRVRLQVEVVGQHEEEMGLAGAVAAAQGVDPVLVGVEGAYQTLQRLAVGADGAVPLHALPVPLGIVELLLQVDVASVGLADLKNDFFNLGHL